MDTFCLKVLRQTFEKGLSRELVLGTLHLSLDIKIYESIYLQIFKWHEQFGFIILITFWKHFCTLTCTSIPSRYLTALRTSARVRPCSVPRNFRKPNFRLQINKKRLLCKLASRKQILIDFAYKNLLKDKNCHWPTDNGQG